MTIDEAYVAMFLYLDAHYKRTHSDDIGDMLGWMNLIAPQTTIDPAAWYDWEIAVAAAPSYLEQLKKLTQESDSKRQGDIPLSS